MKIATGFTLVEVLVVIALVGTIVVAASPLTGSIIHDSDIMETEGQLSEAIGKAKSRGLRNSANARNEQPVVAICISDSKQLTVREKQVGTSPSCANATGLLIWSAQIDSDVSITTSENNVATALSCMCYSNKGLLTIDSCSGCATTSTFTLTAGPKSETIDIY